MEFIFLIISSFFLSGSSWFFIVNPDQSWPQVCTGGNLVIDGTTTTLTQGTTNTYNSILIKNNGILAVGAGDGWTQIGICGGLTIITGGSIQAKLGTNAGGTFATTSADGDSLSYSITVKRGAGGNTSTTSPACPSIQGNGNGGGGDGADGGGAGSGTLTTSGNGGSGAVGAGAAGVSRYGNNGLNFIDDSDDGCRGASGGSVGRFGAGVFLKYKGNFVGDGTEIIDARGSTGGNGGAGGASSCGDCETSCGSGGGGAGGSGGKIVVKYPTGHTAIADARFSVAGGAGGSNGSPNPTVSCNHNPDSPEAGNAGSFSKVTY